MRNRKQIDPKLQMILADPIQKKAAAKQLSARIREINKLAKGARGQAKLKYYDLKAKMTIWGIETFKFRILSRETVGPQKREYIVIKLSDSMVHLPATVFPNRKIIRRIPFKRTLGLNRALTPAMTGAN